MNDATQSAELLRRDKDTLRQRCRPVPTTQRCELCGFAVLARAFYLFACGHMFHTDCLLREMLKHFTPAQEAQVRQLQERIQHEAQKSRVSSMAATAAGLSSSHSSTATEDLHVIMPEIDKLKTELDDLVAAECVLCGTYMIELIAVPFGVDDSWKVT